MKLKFYTPFIFLACLFYCSYSLANDPCTATLLPPPLDSCMYVSGTTVGAIPGFISPSPCSGITGNPDVWYKIIVPACGPDLTINLLGGPSSTGQLSSGTMYLYIGSCSNRMSLGCLSFSFGPYLVTNTLTNLTPGDTIFIRVRELFGIYGAFNLCVFGSCPTGITSNNSSEQALNIFPNPAVNVLSVIGHPQSENSIIEMYDVLGKKVLSQETETRSHDQMKIDISTFPAGIYLLQLMSKGLIATKKFIVEK